MIRRSIACLVVVVGCGGDDTGDPGGGDYAAACARIGSCVGVGASVCFDYVLPGALDDLACVNAAGADCVAVRACLGYQRTLDPSCNPGTGDSCSGGTLIECQDGVRTEIDCSDFFEPVGPSCIMGATRADCGGRTCTVDGERTCTGTILEVCDSSVTEVTDCARLGTTCALSAGGIARCDLTTGATCQVGAPSRCDGTFRVTCDADGLENRLDCDRLVPGWTCQLGVGGTTSCRFGDVCTAMGSDACVGSTLRFCAGGVPAEIDCTTLGFAGCTTLFERAYCE